MTGPTCRWVHPQGFALCAFDTLVHVGTMQPQDKGVRGPSYEGDGLSVSTCPQAWVRIAKLGGLPWFRFTRQDNAFLDAHRLAGQATRLIASWGLASGLVTSERLWRGKHWDDELDAEVAILCATREEAFEEAFGDETRVEPAWTLVARPTLVARMNQRIELGEAEALLQAAYAEDVLGLDGVFWDDDLDVVRYSAPRAVIFRSRLPQWQVTRVPAQ